MNILVTGGAGFVGSHFIRRMLTGYDYRIVNFDKLTYAGNPNNLADLARNRRYRFIHGDICDRGLLDDVFRQHEIDGVVHFAAETHVDRSIADPSVFATTNFVGTQALLDVARTHEVIKFVQISTDEVYGSLGETGHFTEQSPVSPNNPYAASKAGADFMVHAYARTYGLPVNIVRFANTYGPAQHPEKLIPMTITRALENRPIPVHGRGESVRDWCYVKDNAAAIDSVLHRGKPGEVYNIGARTEVRTLDVVRAILELLGKPDGLIRFVQDRPGQDYRYANDPAKIMRELQWRSAYSFEAGLNETVHWYANHRNWWTKLQAN